MAALTSLMSDGIFGLSPEKRLLFSIAALKIQCAVRIYQALQKSKQVLKLRFIKLYDSANDDYVYKDKQTQYIHLEKPLLLGRRDLQTPRIVVAPDDYDPGYDTVYNDGHAIVITVSSFVYSDLIPDLPIGTIEEHETLKEILSHDFICKFAPENVTCLFNPTCDQFEAAFHHLQRVCKTQDYLLVYICTHIGTAYKGEENRGENGYFLMHDTIWKTPKDIANSSISLSTMGKYLNKILCKEKTILLNCAHQDRPPPKFFGSKELYPPRNCFSRLADLSNSIVIGSSSIGALVDDVISHTVLPRQSKDKIIVKSFTDMLMGNSTASSSSSNFIGSDGNKAQKLTQSNDGTSEQSKSKYGTGIRKFISLTKVKSILRGNSRNIPPETNSNNNNFTKKFENSSNLNNKMKITRMKRKVPEVPKFLTEMSSTVSSEIFHKYISDWKIILKPPLKPSICPEDPKLTWSKFKTKTGHDFSFELPSESDVSNFCIYISLYFFHIYYRVAAHIDAITGF